jgi:glycosyl transferase family 25
MNLKPYIINLKHRIDRREHIIKQLTDLDITDFEVVDAVRHDIPWKGCFKSHLKCIQYAKDIQLPYILILEDDCIFTTDAKFLLTEVLNELHQLDWDMFFLGCNLQNPAYKISNHILKITGGWTAHAYMVHSKIYDMILNFSDEKEIDVYYTELMKTHNVYMCDPMIAYQLPSHSDLQHGYRDYNQAMFNNYLTFKP